jgi:hypothetical protein
VSSFLVDPRLFMSVGAVASGDPDLGSAAHLRIVPSPTLGFPLAPFGVWSMVTRAEPIDLTTDMYWHDAAGRLASPNITAAGGDLHGWIQWAPPAEGRLLAVQVSLAPGAPPLVARLLDPAHGRTMVRRSASPYTLAAPLVRHLRLMGGGAVSQILGYSLSPVDLLQHILNTRPDETHIWSLPVDPQAGYANGRGRAAALQRVSSGAPLRLGPPDQPDGPFDALTPAAEVTRVQALAPDVEQRVAELLANRARPGWLANTRFEWPADPATNRPWQAAEIDPQSALLVQAMDPGLGRYLGLMGAFAAPPPADPPPAWIAAGVFAVNRGVEITPGRRLGDILPAADAQEGLLLNYMRELFPDLNALLPSLAGQGLEARVLVTVAAAPLPPDTPEAPPISVAPGSWERNADASTTAFRTSFLFEDTPLGALVAIGRQEGGTWQSRHRFVDMPVGSTPARRAVALLLGREQVVVPLTLPFGATTSISFLGRALATDQDIPADGAPLPYRFYLGDLFGRFGAPQQVAATAPQRPLPPEPGAQTLIRPPAVAPAGDAPASPGTLEVRVPVPTLLDLAAGSKPIATVQFALEGDVRSLVANEGTTATIAYDLPPLLPMEERQVHLSVNFIDSAGVVSPTFAQALTIDDPRPPVVIPTGPGIIWTSLPGPSEEVELKLSWPGAADARFRVYLADARGLDVPLLNAAGLQRARAEIAVDGANLTQQPGGFDGRAAFRLLTDPPLIPVGGQVLLDARLPRSLGVVQFARIVPVSPRGVDTGFATAGLVPVAVPSDRRPPGPRVTVSVDPDSGAASVTITAVGLDLAELAAAEPGLFQNPLAADARRPEYRLRRASASVSEPVYAREIARGPLDPVNVDGTTQFQAVFVDTPPGGLPWFFSYSYWAEVRFPPERRLPPGVVEVPPPGGVQPIEPRQVRDAQRAFSLPSAPGAAVRVPSAVPALTTDMVQAQATLNPADPANFQLVVTISGAPTTLPGAVGGYTVTMWLSSAAQDIQSLGSQPLSGGALNWSTSVPLGGAAAIPPSTLIMRLTDPIGRNGPLLQIPAQLPA